ncbi:MAG: hypothetical protein ACLGIN_14860, partial [Candidatus Sericytochromatia bacterium]
MPSQQTRALLPLFALALVGCTHQAPAPVPPSAVPVAMAASWSPLETIVGYRLLASGVSGASEFSVLGVSPPVSAVTQGGQRFMIRPGTHEVLRLDDQGGLAAWGGLGGEKGRFNQPASLSASEEVVYVADTFNHRIQRFGHDGQPLGAWGSFGSRPGQLINPRSVEVLPGGLVAVTDDFRVQFFTAAGSFLTELPIAMGAQPKGAVEGAPGAEALRQERDAAIAGIKAVLQEYHQALGELELEQQPDALRDSLAGLKAAAEKFMLQSSGQLATAVVTAAVQRLIEESLPPARKVLSGGMIGDVS